MSDAQGDTPAPTEPSGNSELLDELIFKQDLNEVHLLIDFVSGRADRSLSTLSMPDPADPTNKMINSGDILMRIAKMRYPPHELPVINAQNAAILLMAKDRLSAMAAPARGLTIAYTTMFIDAEAGRSIWSRLRQWFFEGAPKNRHHDTRVNLARRTFPNLRAHARQFRVWRDLLMWFALLWLFLTGLAYWDAGLGRAALESLDQDWKNIVAELKDDPTLIHCNQAAAAEPAKTAADLKTDEVRRQFECRKYNYLTLLAKTAGGQVNDVFHCAGMQWSGKLVHVWCWGWLVSGGAPLRDNENRPMPTASAEHEAVQTPAGQPLEQVSDYARANAAYWQTATSILSVFTTYILPMMFALLGTLIGAFRAILNRIGNSELAPRDLVRMKIGIPTGLVAGIAVGLFLSPSSVPVQGTGGVAGQFTLTASGLGFLAGYASQRFFGFLDNMLGTIFPEGSAADPPAARPAAAPRT
jgi:hypothetical protein